MSDRLRTAVIGLGKMGLVHMAAIRSHAKVDLVAAADTSKFVAQAMGKFLDGVRLYEDADRLLAEKRPQAVIIATPTGSHADLVTRAAEAGAAVFVEKPLASALADAERAAAAVRRAGVASHVGYVCRYAPTFETAREVVRSGALGRILSFGSVKYSSDVQRRVEKSWRFLKKPAGGQGGGGVVNEFACHGIDLLVWIFGEPARVTARTESWYSEEVEDYVHAIFEYDGFSGWIDSSWSMQDYRKPYNRIDVTGENGKLTVTDSEVRWMLQKSAAGHEAGWHGRNAVDLYRPVRMFVGDIMFSRQDEAFVEAAAGGPPTRSPLEEGLRTQRVLEAVRGGDRR